MIAIGEMRGLDDLEILRIYL